MYYKSKDNIIIMNMKKYSYKASTLLNNKRMIFTEATSKEPNATDPKWYRIKQPKVLNNGEFTSLFGLK